MFSLYVYTQNHQQHTPHKLHAYTPTDSKPPTTYTHTATHIQTQTHTHTITHTYNHTHILREVCKRGFAVVRTWKDFIIVLILDLFFTYLFIITYL